MNTRSIPSVRFLVLLCAGILVFFITQASAQTLPGPCTADPSGVYPRAFGFSPVSSGAANIIYTFDGSDPTTTNGTSVPATGAFVTIASNATLKIRGANATGLGPITTATYLVTGSISSAYHTTFVLNHRGKVLQGVGDNFFGQLRPPGESESSVHFTPLKPNDTMGTGSEEILQVSAGYFHTLARVTQGTNIILYAWGRNTSGELGIANRVDPGFVVVVKGETDATLDNVDDVSAGSYHSLAIAGQNDQVYAWGWNGNGRLGTGAAEGVYQSRPNKVIKATTNANLNGAEAVAASAGGHSLALLNDGTIWAWGWNGGGQELWTDGTAMEILKARKVNMPAGVLFKAVAARMISAAIRRDDGTSLAGAVYTWGAAPAEVMGRGPSPVFGPNPVLKSDLTPLTGIKQISCGSQFTLALDQNGQVWTWGVNSEGQLGRSDITGSAYAIPVVLPATDREGRPRGTIVQVATAEKTGFALCETGAVFAWGEGDYGIMGSGDHLDNANPTNYANLPYSNNQGPRIQSIVAEVANGAYTPAVVNGEKQFVFPTDVRLKANVTDPESDAISKVTFSVPGETPPLATSLGNSNYERVRTFTQSSTVTIEAADRFNNRTTATLPVTVIPETVTVEPVPGFETANEGAQAGKVRFRRTTPAGSFLFGFGLDGTAFFSDYTPAVTSPLSFDSGATTREVSISGVSDTFFEGIETVRFTLFAAAGYNVGTPNQATLTIKDTIAPQVSITSPASGTNFTVFQGRSIPVQVTASDADGTIQRIDLYADGVLVGTVTGQSQATFGWAPSASDSNVILQAIATDNDQRSTTSSNVQVSVTLIPVPTVAIVNPTQNQSFVTPASVTVTVSLNDPQNLIRKLEYYITPNGGTEQLIGFTPFNGTQSFTWIGTVAGNYSLKVKALDDFGVISTSAARNFTVIQNLLPSVAITSPVNGATFTANSSISLNATASDPEGQLAAVDFFANGKLIGRSSTPSSPSLTWGPVYGGSYQLTAKAYDRNFGTTTSSTVNITVTGNAGPTVSITSPANDQVFTVGGGGTASVTFTTSTSDPDGISSVELFANGVSKGTASTSSPSFVLTLEPGTYIVTAVAKDANSTLQAKTTSDPIRIEVAGSQPSPLQLVQQIIGTNVTVVPGSIAFKGDRRSTLLFNTGTPQDINIQEGALLTSGFSDYWQGANEEDGTSFELNLPGDLDLDRVISGTTTFDATVLEFDITTTQPQVEIQYVFASEEYNEWVDQFNDVFAIYIDGVNVAVVPGTVLKTAIDTVNTGDNAHLYKNNDLSDVSPTPYNTEFDGFTSVLTAIASITPNQTHHVKIVIADTDDAKLDSGIFIKKASFKGSTP